MARPIKLGLDYFPMDTNVLKNMKIRRLMKKYEFSGAILYFSLLCNIYENSYYIQIGQDYLFDLADQLETEDTEIKAMLDYMVEINLFDAEMWKQNILTSKSIQERYLTAKGRYLNEKKLEKQYLLIPLPEIKARVSTVKTPVCTVKTPVCTVKSAQSIENKSIAENNKENESINNHTHIARESEKIRALKAEWDQWKMEMLNDEDWCASLVRYSGKGLAIIEHALEAMTYFDDFIVLKAQEDTTRTKKEYQMSFIGWWRHNNWETNSQLLTGTKQVAPPRPEYKKPAARKSRYEEMMEVAAEAKLLTKKMYENNGFGYTIENSLEATTDYTV